MISTIMLAISLLDWVYVIITVAYICTVLSIIWVVISENRNPVRSLAWITVLLMVPVVGIVLYMFFGRSLRSTLFVSQRLRRMSQQELKAYQVDIERLGFSQNTQQTIRLAHTMCRAYYFSNNKVDIYTNGTDKFDALRADLRAATQYIKLHFRERPHRQRNTQHSHRKSSSRRKSANNLRWCWLVQRRQTLL